MTTPAKKTPAPRRSPSPRGAGDSPKRTVASVELELATVRGELGRVDARNAQLRRDVRLGGQLLVLAAALLIFYVFLHSYSTKGH